MTTLAAIAERAARDRLAVTGAFHAGPENGVEGEGSLILFGPDEPGFWPHASASPEYADGLPDPIDRWSSRIISAIAEDLEATALFPFGSPAWPFVSWALASGRAWSSPVGLLVHDTAGLMVSYRGAIFVPDRLDLPRPSDRPCDTCTDKPCLTACPAHALTGSGYDLAACHDFLDTTSGADCMTRGCQVRRACPVSRSYGRMEEQSAFHMRAFHP